MTYLVSIFVALALLAGFFALTWYESRRGTRVLADSRAHLDAYVERIEFVMHHVDFAAFLRTEVRSLVRRAGHEITHASLQAVRAVERLLTRAAKHLRVQHPIDAAPRESAREFVKTLSDFKVQLKTTRPEISEIQ